MSPAQRARIDEMIEAGESVSQGVIPHLDPVSAELAEMWTTLRSSTPSDHPVSLQSIALLLGEQVGGDEVRVREEMARVRPMIQTMDQAYFGWQRGRREQEQKQREAKAKRQRGARGRR